jgi:hypothetical protein
VDPVPDPLLLRKSGSAGNRTRDPGTQTTRPQRRSVSLIFKYWNCQIMTSVKLISEFVVPKAEMVTKLNNLEFVTGWHSRKSELGHRNLGTECPSQTSLQKGVCL